MINSIKPEDYIFKFGKYINMRAIDIAELYKVNPKQERMDMQVYNI